MKKRKQRRWTSISTISGITHEHPRPVLSLLKGLIRRKDKKRPGASTKNQIKQHSDGEQSLHIDIMYRQLGITPSECSLSKEQSHRDPKQTVKNYTKPSRVPKISHLRAGNYSNSNKKEKTTSVDKYIDDHRNHT